MGLARGTPAQHHSTATAAAAVGPVPSHAAAKACAGARAGQDGEDHAELARHNVLVFGMPLLATGASAQVQVPRVATRCTENGIVLRLA